MWQQAGDWAACERGYAYAGDGTAADGYNNPVKFVDPSGHTVCKAWAQKVLCGFWQNTLNAASEVASLAVDGELLVTDRVTPPPSANDVTDWLAHQLTEAPNSAAFKTIQSRWQEGDVPGASATWARHVATGAIWDFKTDLRAPGIRDSNNEILLGGEHLNYQVVANIFYGYIGRAIGMGEGYLQLGAGIAQVENGLLHWLRNYNSYPPGWGDQEFDAWAIGFGSYLFELYGDDPSKLTKDSLAAALNDYIQSSPIPELK